MNRIRHFLVLALAALAAHEAAQSAWPDKPITIIVPFPPGGVADTVARPVAEAPGRELKQTVVIEIRDLTQSGYPAQFAQWSALFVPAGTSDEIVQKRRAAAKKAAADPQVAATIQRAVSPIDDLDAPDFQSYRDADARPMTDAVRRISKVE